MNSESYFSVKLKEIEKFGLYRFNPENKMFEKIENKDTNRDWKALLKEKREYEKEVEKFFIENSIKPESSNEVRDEQLKNIFFDWGFSVGYYEIYERGGEKIHEIAGYLAYKGVFKETINFLARMGLLNKEEKEELKLKIENNGLDNLAKKDMLIFALKCAVIKRNCSVYSLEKEKENITTEVEFIEKINREDVGWVNILTSEEKLVILLFLGTPAVVLFLLYVFTPSKAIDLFYVLCFAVFMVVVLGFMVTLEIIRNEKRKYKNGLQEWLKEDCFSPSALKIHKEIISLIGDFINKEGSTKTNKAKEKENISIKNKLKEIEKSKSLDKLKEEIEKETLLSSLD